MLQIKVVAVGKIKEKYLQAGIEEYTKRLRAYVKLETLELEDEPCSDRLSAAEEEQVKSKEGERILRRISSHDYCILLDVKGQEMDSLEIADFLDDLALRGNSSLAFVIGGSLGLGANVYARADYRWSLSKLTFPHQVIRLILLEQLYRASRISRGEPYHK